MIILKDIITVNNSDVLIKSMSEKQCHNFFNSEECTVRVTHS